MIESPAVIDAAVLLTTLVIVVVSEASSTARDVDISEEAIENAKSRLRPLKLGRIFPIHAFNLSLLSLPYLYLEYNPNSGPTNIAIPVILLLMVLLPVIEIDRYDELIRNFTFVTKDEFSLGVERSSETRLGYVLLFFKELYDSTGSFVWHLISVFIIHLLIERYPDVVMILFILPLVLSWVFASKLCREIEPNEKDTSKFATAVETSETTKD